MSDLQRDVAERVMGWRWVAFEGVPTRDTAGYPAKCRVRMFCPPDMIESNADTWIGEATGDEPLSYKYCSSSPAPFVPDWHSDPGAAWQVVERMRELGWTCVVTVNDDGAWCELARYGDEIIASSVVCHHSLDMPEAVCRAALAAVEASHERST